MRAVLLTAGTHCRKEPEPIAPVLIDATHVQKSSSAEGLKVDLESV